MILVDTIDIDYERSTISLVMLYFFAIYFMHNLR